MHFYQNKDDKQHVTTACHLNMAIFLELDSVIR